MDAFSVSLGRHRVMGCPYHGLVRTARLTLPNGLAIDGRWFAGPVRGSYRVAVPDVVPVVREPAEIAADTLAGYEWRTDAVVALWNDEQRLYLYDRIGISGDALYAQAVGNCWAVQLPFDRSMDAGKTQLVEPAMFSRFGALSFSPVADERPITVTLSGYNPLDSDDYPRNSARTWDSLPDGSQVILGGLAYDGGASKYVPFGNFDLLRIGGEGTAESPFTAQLEKLSDSTTGTITQIDDFVTWSGVVHWAGAYSEEWIAPIDDSAGTSDWLKASVTGSTLILDPAGIPSIQTPAISLQRGERSAKFLGHVIGWWFVDGVPQPVTLDMEYTLTAEWDVSAGSVASTPQVTITKYDESGPVPPEFGGSYSFDPGVFDYSGTLVRSTTETLTRRLKVGGVLIDSFELIYEDIDTRVLSGTETSGGRDNEVLHLTSGTEVDSTWTRRLLVDGVEIDSATINESGPSVSFGLDSSWVPTRSLDFSNRFASADPVSYWLPQLQDGSLPAAVASVKWSCAPHWWSNHLVCLRRKQSPYLGSTGRSDLYGPTAYPGGVAGSVSSPAPSPSTNAPPLYGARDPLNGTVLLGDAEPVTYV